MHRGLLRSAIRSRRAPTHHPGTPCRGTRSGRCPGSRGRRSVAARAPRANRPHAGHWKSDQISMVTGAPGSPITLPAVAACTGDPDTVGSKAGRASERIPAMARAPTARTPMVTPMTVSQSIPRGRFAALVGPRPMRPVLAGAYDFLSSDHHHLHGGPASARANGSLSNRARRPSRETRSRGPASVHPRRTPPRPLSVHGGTDRGTCRCARCGGADRSASAEVPFPVTAERAISSPAGPRRG